MVHPSTLSLALLLAACSGKEPAPAEPDTDADTDSDTDADTDTDTDADTDADTDSDTDSDSDSDPRPEEGVYTGVITAVENNTCGGAIGWGDVPPTEPPSLSLYPANPVVHDLAGTSFSLDFTTCDVGASGVTCADHATTVVPGQLLLEMAVADFAHVGPAEFTLREQVVVECDPALCGSSSVSFPCSFDLLERFLIPAAETDFCFDGRDNDRDGMVDRLDSDCPAFTAAYWSVDGEFGYEEGVGVVPFVLDGVEHPPVVNVHVTAGSYTSDGFVEPSREPDQTCTLALTYTGTDPVPTTIALDHLAWTLPAGQFGVVEDCTAKGLTATATFGTLADLAAAGWGLAVGPLGAGLPVPPLPHSSDLFGARAHVPLDGLGWEGPAAFGLGYAVDASGAILNESGAPATAADVAGDTLLELDRAEITPGFAPSGAYRVVSPPLVYLGD